MQQTHIDRAMTGSMTPAARDLSAPQAACPSATWQQVWTALGKARAQYDPRILAAAEDAVLTLYQPIARGIASTAASARRLSNQQAEQLADRGLAKAIRDCRAWDIHGFELYVHAAIESELRNAVMAERAMLVSHPGGCCP